MLSKYSSKAFSVWSLEMKCFVADALQKEVSLRKVLGCEVRQSPVMKLGDALFVFRNKFLRLHDHHRVLDEAGHIVQDVEQEECDTDDLDHAFRSADVVGKFVVGVLVRWQWHPAGRARK
jgi:hypothetical protein